MKLVGLNKLELRRIIRKLEREKELRERLYTPPAVKKRDGYKCRLCFAGEEAILEAHHLTPKSLGGKNNINNLITVCKSCHFFLHCNPKMIMAQKEKHIFDTKKGLSKARLKGKQIGRPSIDINPNVLVDFRLKGLNIRQIAEKTNLGVGTVHKILNDKNG